MLKRNSFSKTLLVVLIFFGFYVLDCYNILDEIHVTDKENGLLSILTGNFMHSGYEHFIGNLHLLVLCCLALFNFFPKKTTVLLFALGILIPAIVSYYLDLRTRGASGIVYTLFYFVIFAGLRSKDITKFTTALVLFIFEGYQLTKGVFPEMIYFGINWVMHLTGLLTGFVVSIGYDYNSTKEKEPKRKL